MNFSYEKGSYPKRVQISMEVDTIPSPEDARALVRAMKKIAEIYQKYTTQKAGEEQGK